MSVDLVCQKCKQPLQLDPSLSDLTPSSYDLLASSLPPATTRQASEKEKLERLPAPESVKDTWRRAQNQAEAGSSSSSPRLPTRNLSPRALGKQPQRAGVGLAGAPTESFVFLQDSVVHKIPSSSGTPARPGRTKGRDATTIKLTKAPSTSSTYSATRAAALSSPSSSNRPRPTSKLFSLLSSRTDIDHPLCSDCTEGLLKSLNEQLKDISRERDGYIAFEKELKKERQREEEPIEEVEKRIERLKEEERLAIEDLREAQREKDKLDEELRALELEEKELEEEEAEFWIAHNNHLITSAEQTAQLESLRAAYIHDSAVLDTLERTNVYNDAFCIGHDGVFGTINGLRLGRVSGGHVEWSEINAAWGQALLLLYTIARKLDYTFETFRLVPMGSFSRIEKVSDKSSYELHGSGDLHLGRLLHNRRFDYAMVAFLDCLRQVIDYVKAQDPSADFPHPVVKDKIGDVSIKLQFGVEEAWTRALRHVLLALKLLLKWTTSSAA